MISTAGGLLASGRTAEAEGGQVYVGGRHGVEVMGHLYADSTADCCDSQGNLISDTLDWEQSEGGQVQVESPGLVLIGGYARNASSEVVLEQDVTLEIQWIMGDGQPDSFTAVLPLTLPMRTARWTSSGINCRRFWMRPLTVAH